MSRIKVAELAKKFARKLSISQRELTPRTQAPSQAPVQQPPTQYIELDEVSRAKAVMRGLNYIMTQLSSPAIKTRGPFNNEASVNTALDSIKRSWEPVRVPGTTQFNVDVRLAQNALDQLLPLKRFILELATALSNIQSQLGVSNDLTNTYYAEIDKKLV